MDPPTSPLPWVVGWWVYLHFGNMEVYLDICQRLGGLRFDVIVPHARFLGHCGAIYVTILCCFDRRSR